MNSVGISIKFDDDGLVPVIVQDAETQNVLMHAYATKTAILESRDTGYAHYFSRSRNELWKKGETSGHTQQIVDIRVDCDGDALLYRVKPRGGACHTGHPTCFYRTIEGNVVTEPVFDPDDVYE